MVLTVILVAVLLSLVWLFYRQRKAQMMIFKKMGIPGPKPNILFGNLLALQDTPLYLKQQEWKKEYGETYGYFEGPTPVLVTSDVNFLQEVFIKQFNKFHSRKLWPVQVDPDTAEDVHLFFARGRRWKRLRNVVTPAFSASKMKYMAPTVNECINHLLDVIRDKAKAMNDRSVELFELFRRLTLDSILRCEMGIEQNSVKNPDDPFLRHCKGIIDDTAKNPWLYTLGFIFPTMQCVWISIYRFLHNIRFNPVFWVEDRMREVVELRRNMTEDRADLMQQMLNAQFNVEHVKDIDGIESKEEDRARLPKSMTNEEIVSHALLFLLAGYETTSTTLAYAFYELSQNPQVQHQLRQEVMTVLPRGYNSIAYDDLKKLKYLDYVIWETLRKYPLASTVTARQCMKECKIGDIVIPPGMLVHANLWDVQYDPRHWGDNPHEFDPLRFIPSKRKERHPMSWMPFGGGPRSCAGIRFAFLQLKMVLAKLLRDFDFQPSLQLTSPLNLKQGATIMPADGIHLSAMRRGSAMSDCGNDRRGSILATLGLDDMDASRRSSVQEEEMESIEFPSSSPDNNCYRNRFRRRSTPLIASQNRLPQINVEEYEDSLYSESDVMNEDSIITGFEMLRRASLNKGLEFLLKTSNLDLSPDGEMSRRSSVDSNFMKPDDTSLFTTLLEDSVNRYNKTMSRRGSALPVLESVGEYKEMTSFITPPFGHLEKESWQRAKHSNRLAHRRGSG